MLNEDTINQHIEATYNILHILKNVVGYSDMFIDLKVLEIYWVNFCLLAIGTKLRARTVGVQVGTSRLIRCLPPINVCVCHRNGDNSLDCLLNPRSAKLHFHFDCVLQLYTPDTGASILVAIQPATI